MRYDADDAENDVGHLAELLDIAVETLMAIDAAPASSHDVNRLSALLWVARDRAETIRGRLTYVPRSYLTQEGGAA